MTVHAYYVEREQSDRWAIFVAPGDDGYPFRHVATLKDRRCAERVAETLQYIAR